MSNQYLQGRRCARACAVLTAMVAAGCGVSGDSSGPRPTLSLSTLGVESTSTYYENGSNDGIQAAEDAYIGLEPRVIRGRVGGASDVDVYDLGPAAAGDRIIVDVVASSQLDVALALFDGAGDSLLVNDHRNVYLGQKQPFVDVVIRQATNACYVAIAATPGFDSSGDYALQVQRREFAQIPEPRADEILLVFSGGNGVYIGSRGPLAVPVFDAADIDTRFSGQTQTLMSAVVSGVRRDFAGLNITINSTSEGATHDGEMSRVFFGTYDPGLLGVAEGVDEFNAARSQEAIIFTNTFSAFNDLSPSIQEMGRALANVTSHEIGHLLGLIHTTDQIGIMDVTASLRALLGDQTFRRSPIYALVFPVGAQDAMQSLMDSLGADPLLAVMKYVTNDLSARDVSAADFEPSARAQLLLSGCGLDER